MKTSQLSFLFAAAAVLLPATSHANPTPPPKTIPAELRVEHYVEPTFPASLRNKSVAEGYAQVQLLIAADGTLLESFVSAFSRPEFAESAESALRNWSFLPAADPAGQPMRLNLRINFRREGMLIIQGDFHETINAFLGHKEPGQSVEVCKLRDLDTTPEPVNLVVPLYPAELKKQRIEGAAAISFFIDEKGLVRVPAVAGATRPEFAAAALAAVKQWTFAPPTRKGEVTRVLAMQEFNFTPDVVPAEAKAAR